MAYSLLHLLFISVITFLLISPSISHHCSYPSGPNVTGGCSHLPSLKASFDWAYNATNTTLSITFTAPLASPDGWVSWGINPNGTGMIGTEALIAFKDTNGSLVVKKYNLNSYKSVVETDRFTYKVLDSKAEYSNNVMKILATLVLPAQMTTVNQVWQVGPAVKDGRPMMHKLDPDNMKSKGTLNLATTFGGDENNATAPAPAPAGGDGQSGNKSGGSSTIWSNYSIFYVFVMFLGVLFF